MDLHYWNKIRIAILLKFTLECYTIAIYRLVRDEYLVVSGRMSIEEKSNSLGLIQDERIPKESYDLFQKRKRYLGKIQLHAS